MNFESWWIPKEISIGQEMAVIFEPIAKLAWQASRENMQEYQKYEFCRAFEPDGACIDLVDGKCTVQADFDCQYTAKELHRWLQDNGYRIVKDK
jgi:hypothetical protein